MNNLISILIFFSFISPNVWGNENKNINIESDNLLAFYEKNNFSLGLNITPNESIWSECEQDSLQQNNLNAINHNTHNIHCNTQYIQKKQDLFIGIQLSKKDESNRFTVSLQGGFNFGIRNEYRDDGTQKIRVHANIKGNYDWGFMKGRYKGIFRFVSPGSTPYSNNTFNDNVILNREHKLEGWIFNKDVYVGVEMSF